MLLFLYRLVSNLSSLVWLRSGDMKPSRFSSRVVAEVLVCVVEGGGDEEMSEEVAEVSGSCRDGGRVSFSCTVSVAPCCLLRFRHAAAFTISSVVLGGEASSSGFGADGTNRGNQVFFGSLVLIQSTACCAAATASVGSLLDDEVAVDASLVVFAASSACVLSERSTVALFNWHAARRRRQ